MRGPSKRLPIRVESISRRLERQAASRPKFKFSNIDDSRRPVEVWRAVEGDTGALVALLRSDRQLGRPTRVALADWLEGKLQPVKLSRGNKAQKSKVGWAWWRFDRAWTFIEKRRRRHKPAGRRHWSQETLMAIVAEKEGVDPESLKNFARRSRPKRSPSAVMKSFSRKVRTERQREAIAREVRSSK